ncbi:glycosyltransferase family 2 protein [Thalassospira lucentensis]|uniref:glycosyltransferase family 2 protein n=1 Tax=Thalassospira lucentensis TaxID=168935 RepID=UPI003AA96876
MTKVSFVVTVFNKEEYLPLVIRSLDSQIGDFEREYVFVDDGSTDGSVDVIKECTKDAGFEVKIVRQVNQGASVAHDAGVEAATGEWIKFCDGDDLLAPDATRNLLNACERHGTEHAWGDLEYFEFGGDKDPLDRPTGELPEDYQSIDDGLSFFIRNCPANSTSMLIGRAFYLRAGGCNKALVSPDQMLFLRLFRTGAGVHLKGAVGLLPDAAPGRLSSQKGRSRYESVLALYTVMTEAPGVSKRHQAEAYRRAIARAYRFDRRNHSRTVSGHLWRYLESKVRVPANPESRVYAALGAFTEDGSTERPENWKPSAIRKVS